MKKKLNRWMALILMVVMLPWQECYGAYVYGMDMTEAEIEAETGSEAETSEGVLGNEEGTAGESTTGETVSESAQEQEEFEEEAEIDEVMPLLEEETLSDMKVSSSVTLTENKHVKNLIINYRTVLNLNGYTLTVEEDVICEGRLYVNNGTLMCSGNVTVSYSGLVQMTKASDYVYVKGNLLWNSSSKAQEYLTNGKIELQGNLEAAYQNTFKTANLNKMVLCGNNRQVISLLGENSGFSNLEITNASDEGIYSENFLIIENIEDHGHHIQYADESAVHGYTLKRNTTIEGDLLLYSGIMDLNGYTLTVKGDFIQQGGTVNVHGGGLVIEGDYRMQSRKYVNDETVYGAGLGKLVMTNRYDKVLVHGNFIDETKIDHTDCLTNGYLYAYGDVTVLDSGCEKAFAASENHTLYLYGNEKQTVTFPESTGVENTRINNIYYMNTSDTVLEFIHEPFVSGTFSSKVSAPENITGYVLITENSLTKEFAGNAKIVKDTIIDKQAVIRGDVLFESITINADMIIYGNMNAEKWGGIYGTGSVRIQGDISLKNGGSIRPEVILDGTCKQTINIGKYGNFQTITIENTSEEGIFSPYILNYQMLNRNGNRLSYGEIEGEFGYTLEEDTVIEGDYGLIGDTLDLNGHTLTVQGNFYHNEGKVYVNNGTLVVNGDYIWQKTISTNEDTVIEQSKGRIIMENSEDSIVIRGNFQANGTYGYDEPLKGIIYVAGDINEKNSCFYSYLQERKVTFVLNGDFGQNIYFKSAINNLILENKTEEGIYFADYVSIIGTLTGNQCKTRGKLCLNNQQLEQLQYHEGDVRLTNNVTIEGDYTVNGNLELNSSSLQGNWKIRGDLTVGSTLTTYGNIEVEGDVARCYGWTIQSGTVHVQKDLKELSNSINIYEGNVLVDGSFLGKSGWVNLHRNNSYLFVGEDMAAWKLGCIGGTIELTGDYDGNSITVNNTGKIIFNGKEPQQIRIKNTGEFTYIEICNEAGVNFNKIVTIEQLVTNGNKITFGDSEGSIGWTLQEDEVIEGDFVLLTGVLDLNGHQLTVTGNFINQGGKIRINNGCLKVNHDLRVQVIDKENESGYSASAGCIIMNGEQDVVEVNGNFVYDSTYWETDLFTDGKMIIYGDFICKSGKYKASGNHTVIFAGDGERNIEFPEYQSSYFNHVIFESTSQINLSGTVYVKQSIEGNTDFLHGKLTISPKVSLPGNSYNGDLCIISEYGNMYINNPFTVYGDVELSGERFAEVVCKDSITVYGNVTFSGKRFSAPQLKVYGNVTIQSTDVTYSVKDSFVAGDFLCAYCTLSGGVLEVKGDIKYGYITAKAEHKLILSGDGRQNITVASCQYETVEIKNYSEEGVYADSSVPAKNLIRNGCRLVYGNGIGELGWTLTEDYTYDGRLILLGDTLDLNGHTLIVNGDFIHHDGIVKINGGTLIVNGDYRMQSIKNPENVYPSYGTSYGKLIMNTPNDMLDINGNLYMNGNEKAYDSVNDGEIYVSGNIQSESIVTTSGNNVLVLDGGSKQAVSLSNSILSGFKIINGSAEGVNIARDFQVTNYLSDVNTKAGGNGVINIPNPSIIEEGIYGGNLKITDKVVLDRDYMLLGKVECVNDFYMREFSMYVNNLTISQRSVYNQYTYKYTLYGSNFYVEDGTLTVSGKLTVKDLGKLIMQKEKGFVTTNDFTMSSTASHKGYLTKGTLYITGDFEQSGAVNFIATDKHVTILDGKVLPSGKKFKQTIHFAQPGNCYFNQLILTRNEQEGYAFNCSLKKIYKKLQYELKQNTGLNAVKNIRLIETDITKVTFAYDFDDTNHEVCGYEIYRNEQLVGITSQKTYTDTGLMPSTKYQYTIYAFDADKRKSDTSPQFFVTTTADVTAPDAVDNLHITERTGSSVTLSWGTPYDDSGVKSYTVYRNGTRIAVGITTTTYTNTGLKANEEYTYEVTATDMTGKESAKSNSVLTTVLAPEIASITSLQGTLLRGSVALKASFLNQGTVNGTKITFQYQDLAGTWKTISTVSSGFVSGSQYNTATCSWNTSSLTIDEDVLVRATITDAQKNTSSYECIFHIDNVAPESVEQIEADTDGGMVDIRWKAGEEADCAGYRIYRREANGKLALYAKIGDRYETVLHDSNVVTGVPYTYVITAIDRAGNESKQSGEISITPGVDETAPVVTELTCKNTVIGNRGVIKIGASDNKGISRMALYYEKDGTWNLIASKNTKSGELLLQWDTAAYEEGEYTLRARAWDDAGNVSSDEESPSFICQVDHTGPDAVKISKTEAYSGAVRLEWEPVEDKDFGYFVIEQQEADGTYKEIYRTDYYLAYMVTGLIPETEYTFRVVACDVLDNRGAKGDAVTVITPADENKPGILSINAVKNKNELMLSMEAADDCGIDRGIFTVFVEGKPDKETFEIKAGGKTEASLSQTVDVAKYDKETISLKYEVYDIAGNKDEVSDITCCIDNTPPDAVKNLRVTDNQGSIALSWDEAPETDLAYYRVYRADMTGGIYRMIATEIYSHSFVDSTVSVGRQYQYVVTAVDTDFNESEKSNVTYGMVTDDKVKPIVRGIGPVCDTVGADSTITIFVTDNAALENVAVSYRNVDDSYSNFCVIKEWSAINGNELYEEFTWNTEELKDGGKYEIRVEAVDKSKNRAVSMSRVYTLDNIAPQKPIVEAVSGNFKATINISAPAEEDFSHYEIRRRKLGNLNFETVAELVENTYTDTELIPNITYFYQVIAYDIHGNISESEITEVVAGDTDDVAPTAVTAPLIMGLAGKEVYFDASMSKDNVGIAEYQWNLGDGIILYGSRCMYTYEKAGSYSVKLTVRDKEGNTDTQDIIVTIRSKEDCGEAVVTVKNQSGRVIPNAPVYVMLGETEYANLTTDSMGQVLFAGPDGIYTVMAYSDGYTPASCTVEISKVKHNEFSLTLSKNAIVQGDVKVHKLSLQELIELGVDLRDLSNFHTYTFKVTFVFEEKKLPDYVFITANSSGVLSVEGAGNGSGSYMGGGYYWSMGGGGMYGITTVQSEAAEQLTPEPILAYLSVTESISWLKDMYQVEMEIINCADKNFTLENATAVINLPKGLSLAKVKGGQDKNISMGKIPGQTTGIGSWIVRGDESGSYDISVDFNATLEPFHVPVKAEFQTKQEFVVTTGEGIIIYVYPEMEAYMGKHYFVQYEIYNGSGKELYNFRTTMGSYRQEEGYGEITVLEIDEEGNEKKTIVSSLEKEVEETDPISGETTTKTVVERPQMHYNVTSNQCGTVSVAYGGSTYRVGVFYPGERLYGTYMTTFQNPDTESDPDTVYYELIDYIVEELRGANLGVEVIVIPVKSHINRYLYDARPVVENTYADPIDITTGAFTESKTALTVSGGKQIDFTLNYNSLLAEYAGELGYGWSHDYESSISNYNGQLILTMGAGRQANFLSENMMNGVIYGSYLDDNTIQVDASRMYTGKFACVTGGMEEYCIIRNADGTYELHTPNQDTYYYNEAGKLMAMKDVNGRCVTVTRNGNNIVLTDSLSGAYLTLHYNEDGRIISVTDNIGNEATFTYASGRLASYSDAVGTVITYEYDMNNHIVDSAVNGRVIVENKYDEEGRIVWQKSGSTELTMSYEDEETGHKVILTDGNGNTSYHVMDTKYRVISTTDGNGNTTEYTYDPAGNLLRENKPDGTQIRYQYDTAGNMTQIRAEDGCVTDMTYDVNGNITKVSDTEKIQYFEYDENNRLIKNSSQNGRTETFEYGEYGYMVKDTVEKLGTTRYEFRQGRMTATFDAAGRVSRMEYDAAGRLKRTTDALGNATTYEYNAKGDNIRIINALGGTSTYEYDYNGNVTKAVDALGYVVTSAYDDAGNLTLVTDKLGNTTRYIRDGIGNIIRKEYADGTTENYTYDGAGNNTSITNILGQTSTFEYDSMNRMTKSTDANGLVTLYDYDARGRLIKTTFDDGSFTSDEYDIHGRVVSSRLRDGSTLKYTYDSQGNVTSITDSLNVTVQYRYDEGGRLTAVTDGNGNTTTYAYDTAGNCTGQTTPDKTHVKMTYDALGRMTSVSTVTPTYGEVSVRYEYDALGRVIKTTDEIGTITSFEYDAMDNLIAVYDAEGNKTVSYTYDAVGNVLTAVDALGNKTQSIYDTRTGQLVSLVYGVNTSAESTYAYKYDTAGRLVSVTDPLSGISTYTYDKTGNISSVTDPMGGTTTYTYDPMGRITAICNAVGSTSRYTYDEKGRLSESENARGQKTEYTYDALGRVSSFADEAGTAEYFYDNNGNVLSITEKLPDGTSRTISRTYDCMNRVSSYTDYKGNTIQYGYDELGNVITLTYAGGEIVRYAYYPNGLLKSVTDVKGNITSYEYDSKGNVTKTIFADGTVENCEYNALGYVTVQETTNAAGALLSRYEYAYDERGNVVTATGMDFGDTRKVTEAEYKYDAANRLISYNGKEVQYDKDGNMTYGPLDGEMVQYEYDCRNRLVKAGDTEYEYDAENNRIAVETGEYREEYVVNVNAALSQVLTAARYEKGGLGSDYYRESVITTYTYGNGLVSQYTEESGTEYYHYNNIGSTMYLTKNGVKTHEFAYSTYGELTKGEYGEVRFMYNGRLGVATDDNGLYYMRARYYNPEIRRFINQDIITGSIENSQSLNRYAYCQGNPVNYLDPFGLSPQSFGSWAGHTILNLLSFVPVFGNAADAFNAIWYAYEGNYAEAIACAVGAIPLIGNLATGFKIGSKVVKGCNIVANGGKAAIGFYNGVQNVMNVDRMIRTGTGRWYDYLGQGVQFGLNMFVSAVGVSGAWSGISNLVGELNYKKMQSLAQEVSWKDIDGGAELTGLLENIGESGSGSNQTLLSGEEWYRYFQDTYGADNVNWNVNSFDDMLNHPTSLRGYSADEIGQILGDGWTRSTYGSNGSGWKFIEDAHSDNMVFYHGGGGVHEGAYWGVKSGKTGTIKVVNTSTYVPLPKDKATIVYRKDW